MACTLKTQTTAGEINEDLANWRGVACFTDLKIHYFYTESINDSSV